MLSGLFDFVVKVFGRNGVILFVILGALFLSFLLIPGIFAAEFPGFDGELRQREQLEGHFATVAGGAGMTDVPSATVNLDVPGAVVRAYLYWAGFDDRFDPDNHDDTVTFQVDDGTPQSLTADDTFGPSFWFGNNDHFVYVKDVSTIVQSGTHSYTVSDFDMTWTYGFGLLVVYEDPALPLAIIDIRDGLDSVYWNFPPPRDSPSAINCFEFQAWTESQTLEITLFAGGIDNTTVSRPNRLWYQTGRGIPPATIANSPAASFLDNPFAAYDGHEWDTYVDSLTVDAGDTFACFQMESVDDGTTPGGSSFVWLGLTGALYPPVTTAVTLQQVTVSSGQMWAAPFPLVLALLLLATVWLAVVSRKEVS